MNKYYTIFKKQNIVYKAITIAIILFIAFFLFRIVKNTVVGLDYPNELLEPANVLLTESLLNGNIPYDSNNIVTPGQEPPINFEYPFLHCIFAAGFSYLTGGDVVAAHYIVSFLSMIISAVIAFIILLRYSRTTVAPALGALMIMFCHWRYGYISASPDGFGLMVTLITLYLVTRPKLKHRELWCAIGTVAAFYSKQYYAGVCFSIFIFFWCYSQKSALKYFMWCVIFLAVSMIIITIKWPLFWVYSVLLLMHGCFQGWGADGFLYVLEQMKYLSFIFVGMIAVIVIASVRYIRNGKHNAVASTEDNKVVAKTKMINEGDALPLFLIQIPVQIVMLFIFGRNDGAYLTYFLQLLIPSISIAALIMMEKMEIAKYELIFMGVYGFIVLFTVYFGWGKLPMHMLTDDEVSTWKQAYALIDEYREKGPILHYNVTAYNAIQNGDSVFGMSHDGDISDKNYEEWMNNKIQQELFPHAGAVFEENLAYREVMREKIANQEIALVITPEGSEIASAGFLENSGYTNISTITLRVGNMEYSASFWAY